jgi:multiple sugar transport system substrate-binding protein
MTATVLRGMTWSHPRGYDPLVACSALWKAKTGVEVSWDKRSLQDFESYPVEQLAREYDLIVIDHPHVGQVTAEGCLSPLDVPDYAAQGEALAKASVGASYPSYRWQGRQWALPIDAATQVQAWRPDLIEAPAASWSAMLALARRGQVHCAMRAPHSLMSFYTLAGNLGRPCAIDGPALIDEAAGVEVYEFLRELVTHLDPACFAMDPIDVSEAMAKEDAKIACVPLMYGYVSYALEGFRARRLRFADIPAAGAHGPIGSALGGTGIALSAQSAHKAEALAFAYWVAGAEAQAGPYAASGGQPGYAAAWESPAVNQPVADFYRATRATLEGAWVRPRHSGYMAFQHATALRLNEALRAGESGKTLVGALNEMFGRSFAAQ